MSSRPQFNPYPTILNGDMSMDITSDVTIIQKLSMIGYSYSWAGVSPVGSIVVEISNDYSQNQDGTVKNPGTWTQIYFSLNGNTANSAPVAGNSGQGFIDIDAMSAYAIRTRYMAVSGTGTLQSFINGKVS